MKEYIEAIKLVMKSLRTKEETFEDEINDTFDQVVAIIEERRACLLNQLHSRISSTCEKLGNYHRQCFTHIFTYQTIIEESQRKELEDVKAVGKTDILIDNAATRSKTEVSTFCC